eukprot:9007772-Karenia_brevis.AAC.1
MEVEVEAKDNDADVQMAGASAEGGSAEDKLKNKNERSPTKTEQAPRPKKVAVLKKVAPFLEKFEEVECGGEGDCAYCAVGRGLNALPGAQKGKDEDFKPGGKVVAQLRLLTSAEMQKSPSRYGGKHAAEFDAVSKKGYAADEGSLTALAQAIKTDIMIWRKNEKSDEWTLYMPPGGKAKKKTIWLSLRDKHYKWLKPKTEQSEQETAEMKKGALPYPTPKSLGGGGESEKSADPMQLLGLAAASPSSKNSKSVLRLLGLGSSCGSIEKSKADAKTEEQSGRVTKLLGLDDDTHRPGQHLQCPCGWLPPADAGRVAMLREARQHWRSCQGELPPKADKEHCSKVHKFLARKDVERRRTRAAKKYADWRASIKPKTIRESFCELEEAGASTVA